MPDENDPQAQEEWSPLGGDDDEEQQRLEEEAQAAAEEQARLEAEQQQQVAAVPPPVAPPAPVQQVQTPAPPAYVPHVVPSQFSEQERTQFREAIESWDPDKVLATMEQMAERKADSKFQNYLAARVQTASDPIGAIADRMIYSAAQNDPTLLTNQQTAPSARIYAAVEYARQTGQDVASIVGRVLQENMSTAAAAATFTPPLVPQQAVVQQAQQAIPATQQVPAASNGARGVARGAGASIVAELEDSMPWARKSSRRSVMEE